MKKHQCEYKLPRKKRLCKKTGTYKCRNGLVPVDHQASTVYFCSTHYQAMTKGVWGLLLVNYLDYSRKGFEKEE